MAATLSSKELKQLLIGLEDQGCRIDGRRDGYRIFCPSGGMFSLHLTLSDRRGMRNLRSTARQEGLEWPLDPPHRKKTPENVAKLK